MCQLLMYILRPWATQVLSLHHLPAVFLPSSPSSLPLLAPLLHAPSSFLLSPPLLLLTSSSFLYLLPPRSLLPPRRPPRFSAVPAPSLCSFPSGPLFMSSPLSYPWRCRPSYSFFSAPLRPPCSIMLRSLLRHAPSSLSFSSSLHNAPWTSLSCPVSPFFVHVISGLASTPSIIPLGP